MPQGPPEKGGQTKLALGREALTYVALSLSLGWAVDSRIHRCEDQRSESPGEAQRLSRKGPETVQEPEKPDSSDVLLILSNESLMATEADK